MATHSNTLAWKIPWKEEPGRLQSMGSWRVRHDWATSLSRIGEGNGNPLQCSCQENPRDSGAWWATIYGVTQSRTRLKWLSNSSSSMHMSIPRSQEESENLRVQAVPWGKVPGYRSQENSSLFKLVMLKQEALNTVDSGQFYPLNHWQLLWSFCWWE